jgi:hypothetical protein
MQAHCTNPRVTLVMSLLSFNIVIESCEKLTRNPIPYLSNNTHNLSILRQNVPIHNSFYSFSGKVFLTQHYRYATPANCHFKSVMNHIIES